MKKKMKEKSFLKQNYGMLLDLENSFQKNLKQNMIIESFVNSKVPFHHGESISVDRIFKVSNYVSADKFLEFEEEEEEEKIEIYGDKYDCDRLQIAEELDSEDDDYNDKGNFIDYRF